MPSKDTIPWRLTKGTQKELERWRKKISEALGVNIENITYKEAEIALRECARTGKIKVSLLNDIMIGKIK